MSKQSLQKLNTSLINHFNENGVENAFYYEPLFDYYWLQKDKIGICNLEPYNKGFGENLMGIKKVDDKVIVDCWYGARTVQRTLKMFQLITKRLENGGIWLTEKDFSECNNKKVDEVITKDLGTALYFNFRLTIGNHVKENTNQIINFYKDKFYQEYYRSFVKETELNMLIITGKTGCFLINMIYPELNLEYNGLPKRNNDGVLICSIKHPAARNFKNSELIQNINELFDCYESC